MMREEAISRIQRALNVPNRLQGLVLIDEESANMAIEALTAEPNCKDCKKRNNTTFFMDDDEAKGYRGME